MGQLEKYGLYVLCLVIFLILGVTIWGGGDLPQAGRRGASSPPTELNAANPANIGQGPGNASTMRLLFEKDPARNGDPKKDEPKPPVTPKTGEPTPPKPSNEAPAPLAETARPTHKVASGDSFDSIARKLGSAALVAEIQRLNPRVVPTRMPLGQELLLPTKAEIDQVLARSGAGTRSKDVVAKEASSGVAPGVAPAVTPIAGPALYTVVKGDTLEGIAIRQLGSRKRLDELRELNPTVQPTALKVGQKIKLPKK